MSDGGESAPVGSGLGALGAVSVAISVAVSTAVAAAKAVVTLVSGGTSATTTPTAGGVGGGGGGGGAPSKPREIAPAVAKKPLAYPKGGFKPRAAPKFTLARAQGEKTLPAGSTIFGYPGATKVNLDRLVATDAERLAIFWFCENNIPFNFETSLLNGRVELNNTIVPFLLTEKLLHSDYQALRLFEQNDGPMEMGKHFLSQSGFQVIDISPMALLNDADKVLSRVLELMY